MQIAWHESLKFGQLTLGKIIKIVATRCQILRLKCTKFNFGWVSPDPLAGLRGLLLRGGEGKGGDGNRRGGEGGDETPPLHAPTIHISQYGPGV